MWIRWCGMGLMAGMLGAGAAFPVTGALAPYHQLAAPPHEYWTTTPTDRFTSLTNAIASLKVMPGPRREKAYLEDLLQLLDIPVTSQVWVFSATSLQSGLITPRNPRALYFNEDTYLGFIPGGKIEILSMDPRLGAIFYIFDIPRSGTTAPRRSRRCMNCHSGAESGRVPGLSLKSVIPGPNQGSLTAYRLEATGHQVPFGERLGGWYVTGDHERLQHRGNHNGQFRDGQLVTRFLEPGSLFDVFRFAVETSDVLPHLLLEHQAGFINRVVEATYRARTYQHADGGTLSPEHDRELDRQADLLVRYILFADEVPLPKGGIKVDPAYRDAFLQNRRPRSDGSSLRELDLKTRLFRYRCSYMIYSTPFQGLPDILKDRVLARLRAALNPASSDERFQYLSGAEKKTILAILKDTLPGFAP